MFIRLDRFQCCVVGSLESFRGGTDLRLTITIRYDHKNMALVIWEVSHARASILLPARLLWYGEYLYSVMDNMVLCRLYIQRNFLPFTTTTHVLALKASYLLWLPCLGRPCYDLSHCFALRLRLQRTPGNLLLANKSQGAMMQRWEGGK